MRVSAFQTKQYREGRRLAIIFRAIPSKSISVNGISWRTCCDGLHEYIMLMSSMEPAIAHACRTGEHQKAFSSSFLLIDLYY